MSEDSPKPITGEIIPAPEVRTPKVRPKRIRHQQAIDKAEMYAARNSPKYIKLLEGLARGVLMVEETRDGEEIYRTLPDRQALKILLDRGLGTPASKIELTGQLDGTVTVTPYVPRQGCCRDDG